VLFWTGLLVLAAFGIVFTFANYPWFGIGVVLVSLLPDRILGAEKACEPTNFGKCATAGSRPTA
jgi:hypothetical protein